ncbi:MAG: DUF749 family protein [Methanomassiliicoccales archaeon]|nr:DUF749 family protein [Methanomassiliicoccales archaeon]MDD1756666.1 DUF749 family protein [Methanomassiliicoccales archaeon]
MHKARMVGVFTVREMPEELLPFLNIQARRENKELKLSEKVAVFQIESTSSFVVAFLSTLKSADEMEKRLKDQETILDTASKRSLESVLERSK